MFARLTTLIFMYLKLDNTEEWIIVVRGNCHFVERVCVCAILYRSPSMFFASSRT